MEKKNPHYDLGYKNPYIALAFQDILATRRWERWIICFINYNLWLLEGKWRTFCAGEKAIIEELSMMLSDPTKLKSIFMYTFVNWGRVYIEDHTLSLIDFVKWLFVRYGERFFLVSLLFLGFVCMLRVYLFRCLLGASNASPFFRLPKKKNYDLGYS